MDCYDAVSTNSGHPFILNNHRHHSLPVLSFPVSSIALASFLVAPTSDHNGLIFGSSSHEITTLPLAGTSDNFQFSEPSLSFSILSHLGKRRKRGILLRSCQHQPIQDHTDRRAL